MPWWIASKAAPAVWKRIPWKMVWTVSLWLAEKGRERIRQNLTQSEQSEFFGLIKKSKGRPSNLSQRDRTRLKNIAGKAVRGS
ncbi:MAG: hypothetical protein QOE75_1140 [Solirubrobacterales bacterium]|jgi:hypothetical protein|nr:hypothetical protein [Solirubrobacterales bacterium]HWC08969.1 hypothetical protein [Solirubrobacterales bacterium]